MFDVDDIAARTIHTESHATSSSAGYLAKQSTRLNHEP